MIKKDIINGQQIIYQFYQPKYNQQIKSLQKLSSFAVHFFGLIYFGRNFDIPYQNTLSFKGYRDGFIIIAIIINESKQLVIGKIIVALKEIVFNGEPVKAAYLFDLRVDTKIQRLGIASNLLQICIKESLNKGASIMYCSTNWSFINPQKDKAINFFKKNKFKILSSRNFMFSDKMQKKNKTKLRLRNGAQFRYSFQRNAQKHIRMMDQFDMKLQNIQELYNEQNQKFIGCGYLQFQENIGSLALFKDNNQFSMTMQRLFFSKKQWQNGVYKKIMLILFFIYSFLIILSYNFDNYLYFWIPITLLFVAIFFLIIKINQFVELFKGSMGRIVNPVYKGKHQCEQQIMQMLINKVREQALKYDCRFCKYNLDLKDPALMHFNKATGFSSLLLKKRRLAVYFYLFMNERQKEGSEPSRIFFDPRDL